MPSLTEPNDLIRFCHAIEAASDAELSEIVGDGLDAALAATILELEAMNRLIESAVARVMDHSGLRHGAKAKRS